MPDPRCTRDQSVLLFDGEQDEETTCGFLAEPMLGCAREPRIEQLSAVASPHRQHAHMPLKRAEAAWMDEDG